MYAHEKLLVQMGIDIGILAATLRETQTVLHSTIHLRDLYLDELSAHGDKSLTAYNLMSHIDNNMDYVHELLDSIIKNFKNVETNYQTTPSPVEVLHSLNDTWLTELKEESNRIQAFMTEWGKERLKVKRPY